MGGCSSTSITLEDISAQQAMRALHELFSTERGVCITKMRLIKCWISADGFVEKDLIFSQCSLKARVFKTESQKTVIEFRRRCGDALAFTSIFQTAKKCLQHKFTPVGTDVPMDVDVCETRAFNVMDVTYPVATEPIDAAGLQPLIAMVANDQCPEIQAEALVSLVLLANAAAVCVALEQLHGVLARLIISPLVTVAYPAARLSALMMLNGGDTDGKLAKAAQNAAFTHHVNDMVRRELQHAIKGH